ncbi:MAG: hypothetical protein R2758_02835 [Bacteroidales bacterium]
MNGHVLKAVDYIASLQPRSTDHFRVCDSVRAYYGLVPESISHEGIQQKPCILQDNFFIMKGLKDAVEIQSILGEDEHREEYYPDHDEFGEPFPDSRLTLR